MFDKVPRSAVERSGAAPDGRIGPEDERIALRCNRKELALVDSFVANGEFRSRSELMRAALHEFLRTRALSAVPTPAAAQLPGLVEIPVRLRPEEAEAYATYAELVGNGRPRADVLAEVLRRGELELKVSELVARSRASVHEATAQRARLRGLEESGRDLERQGVVGR